MATESAKSLVLRLWSLQLGSFGTRCVLRSSFSRAFLWKILIDILNGSVQERRFRATLVLPFVLLWLARAVLWRSQLSRRGLSAFGLLKPLGRNIVSQLAISSFSTFPYSGSLLYFSSSSSLLTIFLALLSPFLTRASKRPPLPGLLTALTGVLLEEVGFTFGVMLGGGRIYWGHNAWDCNGCDRDDSLFGALSHRAWKHNRVRCNKGSRATRLVLIIRLDSNNQATELNM